MGDLDPPHSTFHLSFSHTHVCHHLSGQLSSADSVGTVQPTLHIPPSNPSNHGYSERTFQKHEPSAPHILNSAQYTDGFPLALELQKLCLTWVVCPGHCPIPTPMMNSLKCLHATGPLHMLSALWETHVVLSCLSQHSQPSAHLRYTSPSLSGFFVLAFHSPFFPYTV